MADINPRSRKKESAYETRPGDVQGTDRGGYREQRQSGRRSGVILLLLGLIAGAILGFAVKTMQVSLETSHRKAEPVLTEEEKIDGIRKSLEEGNSILTTLRRFYRDYIVMYHGDRYNFLPIDQDMKLNNYLSENVRKLSSGEWQYLKNNKVISHKGIDVSSHQGEIGWDKVAASDVEFALIRAMYRGYESGKLVEDTMFRKNMEGALANGIDAGAYIFTQAVSREEVREEFAMLEELLSSYDFKGPVVVDVEQAGEGTGRMDQLSVEDRTDLIKYYCELIRDAGYKPMLYYNIEGALFMLDLKQLEDVDKWFASYNSDFYFPYAYSYWQYTDKGSVDGIEGNVDMDIRFGK